MLVHVVTVDSSLGVGWWCSFTVIAHRPTQVSPVDAGHYTTLGTRQPSLELVIKAVCSCLQLPGELGCARCPSQWIHGGSNSESPKVAKFLAG